MSAKRNKPAAPGHDFKTGGERLAWIRACLIVQQLAALKSQIESVKTPEAFAPKRRGRPKKAGLDFAVADYQFDVNHFDALRHAGWGSVPADKAVLDATLKRLKPAAFRDPQSLESARGSLKDAVKQRRRRSAK